MMAADACSFDVTTVMASILGEAAIAPMFRGWHQVGEGGGGGTAFWGGKQSVFLGLYMREGQEGLQSCKHGWLHQRAVLFARCLSVCCLEPSAELL